MQLGEQAAADLREILQRTGSAEAPPTRPLRRLPTGDASFFK
jgi:hypothetical protein